MEKKNDPQASKKGCVLLIVLAAIMFFSIKWYLTGEEMNIQIDFTGSQLVFKNLDDKDYHDVKITINDTYFLNVGDFTANNSGTVGIMQFSDNIGNRFSIGQKILKIKIEGKDSDSNFVETIQEFK